MTDTPSVGIVGGGLAGLAAAAVLCERGFQVELFEAKRFLGGRAGSFHDPETGELVDHCQHVAMGCCTSFLDFCRRTEVSHLFRQDRVLHFFSPEGKSVDVRDSRWLPAPFHLAPAMMRLGYLTWGEKLSIARGLWALVRWKSGEDSTISIGQWLRDHGQSQRAIDRFWAVVLMSALGEQPDRASVAAARKVFVDGFLANRAGYEVYIPKAPLGEIYHAGIAAWLERRGVVIHLGERAEKLHATGNRVKELSLDGNLRTFEHYILATPWQALARLLEKETLETLQLRLDPFSGSSITSIHLWFDREIMHLPHAVLVDRLTQWIFSVNAPNDRSAGEHYYQAVISASQGVANRPRDSVIAEVLADLRAAFPDASLANLLRFRIITQPSAVFSYTPQLDRVRPGQKTAIDNLFLAGDWTATGWPSTMESAVRSGYLAAAEIMRRCGRQDIFELPADLACSWFVRT